MAATGMASSLPGCGPLRIVVTGTSGFIGGSLVTELQRRGHQVQGWSRQSHAFELDQDAAGLQAASMQWQRQLQGVDVVVHLAARVHQLGETAEQARIHHQRVNTDATLALARAALAAGVARFVFFSTAKVYGEGASRPYTESTVPVPCDAYAMSKLHAEQGLFALAEQAGMTVVVLRPPLVYGAGVGGNFRSLWRLGHSRWPLPLAALQNRRAMVALENLVQAAAICCEDARAAGHLFNVADAQPYSLPEIIGAIRAAQQRSAGLWTLPVPLLRRLLVLLRGQGDAQRLLGDFLLDTRLIARTLDWQPQVALQQAIATMSQRELP